MTLDTHCSSDPALAPPHPERWEIEKELLESKHNRLATHKGRVGGDQGVVTVTTVLEALKNYNRRRHFLSASHNCKTTKGCRKVSTFTFYPPISFTCI